MIQEKKGKFLQLRVNYKLKVKTVLIPKKTSNYLIDTSSDSNWRRADDVSSDGGEERRNEIRLRPLWQQQSSVGVEYEEADKSYEANVEDLIVFVDDDRRSNDSGESPRHL